jgi:hypothetical protein
MSTKHTFRSAFAVSAILALAACSSTNENNIAWSKPGITQVQANFDEQQCRRQGDELAASGTMLIVDGSMATANGTRIQEYKNCISARGYRPGDLAHNDQNEHIGFMTF